MLQEVVKVVIVGAVAVVAIQIRLKFYQLQQAQANNKITKAVRKLDGIHFEVQNVCIALIEIQLFFSISFELIFHWQNKIIDFRKISSPSLQ